MRSSGFDASERWWLWPRARCVVSRTFLKGELPICLFTLDNDCGITPTKFRLKHSRCLSLGDASTSAELAGAK
jgi:hypothetical protein